MSGLFDDIDLSSGAEELQPVAYAEPLQDADPEELVNEALRRIEQAQLYKTLLNHSLFGPGSAREDIQAKVEAEIRAFVLTRLEILVGVRQEQVVAEVQSPFTEEETAVLRSLAQRALNKSAAPMAANPQINPVQARTAPTVNPTRSAGPSVNQVRAPQAGAAAPAAPKAARPRGKSRPGSENVGEQSGKDLSQAVPTKRKPLPMPTPTQMNQRVAAEATDAIGGMESDASGKGGLLKALATIAMKQNANVSEE